MKKNLGFVILGVVAVIGTLALGWMYKSSLADTAAYRAEFEEIIAKKQEIEKAPYAPTLNNLEQLEANLSFVKDEHVKILTDIQDEYTPPEIDQNMTGIEVSTKIDAQVRLMHETLNDVGIETASVPFFGFKEYAERLPTKDERIPILTQLAAVSNIMRLAEVDGSLTAIKAVELPEEINMMERAQYFFYTFQLTVEGPMSSIRDLINAICKTQHFYIIRDLQFEIKAPLRGTAPPVADRITIGRRKVYREQNQATVTLELDYVEFRAPPTEASTDGEQK